MLLGYTSVPRAGLTLNRINLDMGVYEFRRCYSLSQFQQYLDMAKPVCHQVVAFFPIRSHAQNAFDELSELTLN